ncbi:unnamed protein product [Natator depressus]
MEVKPPGSPSHPDPRQSVHTMEPRLYLDTGCLTQGTTEAEGLWLGKLIRLCPIGAGSENQGRTYLDRLPVSVKMYPEGVKAGHILMGFPYTSKQTLKSRGPAHFEELPITIKHVPLHYVARS